MIAHQKKTMTSTQKPAKNDLNNLNDDEVNYLLFTEFFQALEFHDKKNELFNAIKKTDFKDNILRFITGSDCHNWECYPSHDNNKNDEENFRFTYLKCLPTFRGVSLALTEDSRIRLNDSFFSVSNSYLDCIKLKQGESIITIPLSKGINAIIGDNSIGKSLLIHKLTNYYRHDTDKDTSAIADDKIIQSYNKYLEKNNIEIISSVSRDKIYEFDSQGEIRKKFSQNKLKSSVFISKRKKENPNIENIKNQIETYSKLYIENLKLMMKKTNLLSDIEKATVEIPKEDLEAKVLKCNNVETKPYDDLKEKKQKEINAFSNVSKSLKGLERYLSKEELESFLKIEKYISSLLARRQSELKKYEDANTLIALINNSIDEFNDNHQITYDDKIIEQFNKQKENLSTIILSLLENKNSNTDFVFPSLGKTINVPVEKCICGNLKIVTCCKEKTIDDDYLKQLFAKPLKKGKFSKESFLSKDDLSAAISRHDPSADPWEEYKQLVLKEISDDFNEEIKLNNINEDDYNDHSNGLNDKMYFEILSNDDFNEGIYFIDQPEDDVSQISIRDNLIKSLRKMGKNRQVILITHNPQFVVNLDVDNVIVLQKKDDKLCIHSGALEYCDNNQDILNDVAETLDGGVITIRKRWKKYEKNIEDIIG